MLPKKLKIKWDGQGKIQTINTMDYVHQKIEQIKNMLDNHPHIPKYDYNLEVDSVVNELANLLNNQKIGMLGFKMEKDIIKEYKYYSTKVIFYIPDSILSLYNARKTSQNQYDVVFKAKSMAEANRRAKELIDKRFNAFKSGFTYECNLYSHRDVIVECDKHNEIIFLSERPDVVVPLKEIRNLMDKKGS